jgi:hypothetical protein
MRKVLELIEERGVPLRKHRDYSEGVLASDDFMEYLEQRRRYGDAEYVYVRGNDDVLEVSFLDDEDVGRAVKCASR